jgi:hypothetical protein
MFYRFYKVKASILAQLKFLSKIRKKKQDKVSPELQKALLECQTIPAVIDLLFSIDYVKDEAIIDAFDRRIDQLEQQTHTHFYHQSNTSKWN